MTREDLLHKISKEVSRAQSIYPTFNSTHEGYAVLLEEVHELWDMVRKNKGTTSDPSMDSECIQIAAMAIRFIEDLS
jgi:hypothetical protein